MISVDGIVDSRDVKPNQVLRGMIPVFVEAVDQIRLDWIDGSEKIVRCI